MTMKVITWRQDEGSVDLMQLFVGLLIISIASIGTFQSLFYGYDQLDFNMRYRSAVSIARSYVEYWQGRIHTDIDFKDRPVFSGNQGDPEVFLLDERDPTTTYDDVYCEVAYSPIIAVDHETTEGTDFYKFSVIVLWSEPNDYNGAPHQIVFSAAMVPAGL